jgi:hypothetical protein
LLLIFRVGAASVTKAAPTVGSSGKSNLDQSFKRYFVSHHLLLDMPVASDWLAFHVSGQRLASRSLSSCNWFPGGCRRVEPGWLSAA